MLKLIFTGDDDYKNQLRARFDSLETQVYVNIKEAFACDRPCGKDKQRRARKENLYELDGELALGIVKSGRNEINEPRRGPHTESDQHGGDSQQ